MHPGDLGEALVLTLIGLAPIALLLWYQWRPMAAGPLVVGGFASLALAVLLFFLGMWPPDLSGGPNAGTLAGCAIAAAVGVASLLGAYRIASGDPDGNELLYIAGILSTFWGLFWLNEALETWRYIAGS